MNNLNKKIYVTLSSLLLIGLTSCTSSSNKNSNSSKDKTQNTYVGSRTISQNESINVFGENTKPSNTYDYTHGVSTYAPVGEIPKNQEIPENNLQNENQPNNNNQTQNENLFTLNEVQQITNDLTNEYNSYLEINSNEYENYINELSKNYNNLENEYMGLLNDLSNFITPPPAQENLSQNNSDKNENAENNENQNTSNEIESEEKNPEDVPKTREDEINLIYNKALENASKNLDEFEPIQGQAPNENNNLNENSQNQNNELEKINAENIFKMIKDNVKLPNFENKNGDFLSSNYNLSSNNVLDFKLLSSKDMGQNLFEMLIIKTSNISEEDLINKIQSRIDSILNSIPENNNTNLNDKVLLLNIDDYVFFCLSNINNTILNFLENL